MWRSDRNGSTGVTPAAESGYANFLAINKTDLRFYDVASFEVGGWLLGMWLAAEKQSVGAVCMYRR